MPYRTAQQRIGVAAVTGAVGSIDMPSARITCNFPEAARSNQGTGKARR